MDSKGYESRCKVCNSKLLEKIEVMREDGKNYGEIKEFMNNNGEEVSLMSISRHFSKHHPKKIEHLLYINKKKCDEANARDDLIKEVVNLYPYLKEYLHDEAGIYDLNELHEEGTITYKDIFINKFGFCITGQQFCENVPKATVYDVEDVSSEIDRKLETITNHNIANNKAFNLLKMKIRCINCREFYNEVLIEFLIYITIFNGNSIDFTEIRRLLFKEFDCNFKKMLYYINNNLKRRINDGKKSSRSKYN